LDVDSTALNTFDEEDQQWLEELVADWGKWGK
jgi:putative methionine-R-sulfoxide reductase with GAF domain